MGLHVDHNNGAPAIKMGRKLSEVDYIPTLDDQILRQTSASAVKRPPGASRQWGKVKNVAEIFSEYKKRSDDDDDVSRDSELEEFSPKRYGIADVQRTAKVLMKSKKVIEKLKEKYNNRNIEGGDRSQGRRDLSDFVVCEEDVMYNNQALHDAYDKLKRKKQLKIAMLQSRFLGALPKMAKMTVREHLVRKIEALKQIKTLEYGLDVASLEKDNTVTSLDSKERRQSRLRQSVDMEVPPVLPRLLTQKSFNLSRKCESPSIPRVRLSSSDIDREIAISRSRERIEEDLDLPADRFVRLSMLRSNLEKINHKFIQLAQEKRKEGGQKADDEMEEDVPYYAPSRFTSQGLVRHSLSCLRQPLLSLYFINWIATV